MRDRSSHRERNVRNPTRHGEPGCEKCTDEEAMPAELDVAARIAPLRWKLGFERHFVLLPISLSRSTINWLRCTNVIRPVSVRTSPEVMQAEADCSSTREHHSDVDIHLPLFKVDREVCEWDGNRLTNEFLSHESTYVSDLFG